MSTDVKVTYNNIESKNTRLGKYWNRFKTYAIG